MTQKLDTLLSRLQKVKPNGHGKWLACCPAHDDRSPSLAIKFTDDRKILINCFSGCSVVEIVSALGLELSDLMPESVSYKKGSKPPKFNKYELFDLILYHALILEIAIGDILLKKPISDSDLKAIIFAQDCIARIAKEARS